MSDAEEEEQHWTESLVKIRECLQNDDDDEEESLRTATSVIKRMVLQEDVPQDLLTLLHQIWIQCKLHLNQHEEVPALVNNASVSEKQQLQPYLAYALYRQGKHAEAYSKASKQQNDDQSLLSLMGQHVQAQSLFRMYKTHEALNVYQNTLLDKDPSSKTEVLTNAVAVALANGTPYVESPLLPESFMEEIQQALENSEEYPYDLAYNVATLQLLGGNANGVSLLQQAREACVDAMDQEDVDKEVAPIDANLDWSRILLQGGSSMTAFESANAPPPVQAVLDTNQARSMSSPAKALAAMPQEPQEHWTGLQRRIFCYNRACLYCRMGRLKDCRAALQTLSTELLQEGKKKKQTYYPSASREDTAWWQARVDVVEAHCLVSESKHEKAVSLLQDRLKELQKIASDSMVVDHAVAHVQLHLHDLQSNDDDSGSNVLQSLPESIKSQKAVVATLASFYHEAGETTKATSLLQECGADAPLADFYMSQHQYEQAAELYKDSHNDHGAHVQALSFVDPQQAYDVWTKMVEEQQLQQELDDLLLDADALEAMEPPRSKTVRTSKPMTTTAVSSKERQPKSHEAVLRQRAKRREAYLEKKGLTGTSMKPDPERWLPKHERSRGGRRRRRAGQQKSHQGTGVSERDAAKLDVAARKTSSEPSNVKSTAHYTVASDTKRGGRRR